MEEAAAEVVTLVAEVGEVVDLAAEAPETSTLLRLRVPISQTSKALDRTDRGSLSSAMMNPSPATLTRGVEASGIRDKAVEPRTEELAVAATTSAVTLAPSSEKAMHPGFGTVGKRCIVRANHFKVAKRRSSLLL